MNKERGEVDYNENNFKKRKKTIKEQFKLKGNQSNEQTLV